MQILNVSISGGLNLELTPSIAALSTNVSTIVEGNTFTITFITNRPGAYPYTITGVSSSDIGNASLTGNFTANGETRIYTVSDDLVTEGIETFSMALDNGQSFVAVGIDDSYYTLTANVASANEGNVFSITLDTNAIHALPLGYTITGVSNVDFNGSPSLTGNFTANGQVLTYTANLDATTEGVEYFAISLNNGRANANVIINDTSTPYYILTANVASVNEGNSFTVTFLTNAIHELPLGYTITGVSNVDINGASLTGTFTSNGQVLTYTSNVDVTLEGPEYFLLSLNNGLANANVLVNDTSFPVPGQQEYTVPGTYSWVAPSGVSSISVVTVGGGGSGGAVYQPGEPGGGGGGALSWGNATVTPGQTYTVVVGAGGGPPPVSYYQPGVAGGYSAFGSNVIFAAGGDRSIGYTANGGNVIIGQGGGYGGSSTGGYSTLAGGAGAGGYSGNGGNGSTGAGTSGSGGGGGGGGTSRGAAAGGGGVGIYGAGSSGAGGAANYYGPAVGGYGGSGGANAANVNDGSNASAGGRFGGGGGTGRLGDGKYSANGAGGAVRIVWGTGRYYPSTNTANV